MARKPSTIDEYIASFPEDVQPVLERVRRTIRTAIPRAEETIAYNMATFTVDGQSVIHLAGWKAHYSLYPASDRLAAAFHDELAPYEMSGKGTIRFPLAAPIPVKLIGAIARFRATESAAKRRA